MNQVFPAPHTTRQMLTAFGFYEAERGLPSLLGRFEFEGMTRRQVYYSVLGRSPERGGVAADGPNFKPRVAVATALQGDEFQNKIREIVLGAFPDRKRLIFVHIPKCAGTDLLTLLRRRYPYLHQQLCIPEVTSKTALFEQLHHFAAGIALSDRIAVSGHVPLRWYTDRGLLRFEDEVFTTVRHPRDLLYSYISFILTRFVEFKDVRRPDTTGWLSQIGLDAIPADLSPAVLADLGSRLLRAPKVTGANIMCNNLGNGTAASAIDAVVMTDIEITDTARYSAWRTQKFGTAPDRRINPSRPLFTPEVASKADKQAIEALITEDLVLYGAITGRLAAQDETSIRGRVFG